MGEVYLARDTRLGRKVALKLIHEKRLGSALAKQLFLEEAERTARFNHPNIVTLYDAGEHLDAATPGGRLYLALEYLEGESLRERLAREQLGGLEALRILRAVAEGLAEAHRAGVLHRDLKPANVLIPRDGRVRLIDFGLARDAAEQGRAAIVGTPKYMAPEILRGEAATAATDIYSLGLIFREMSLGTVDGEMFLSRCLAEDPKLRPAAQEIADSLDRILSRRRGAGGAPYRGLASFREEDAELFFGRDAEILAVQEILRGHPAVVIVGPSGAGKSSLVFAGLIPRMREAGALEVFALRPGHDPFAALAARTGADARELEAAPERLALVLQTHAKETNAKVLLFVDQLEELSTSVSEETRGAFIRALAAAGDERESPVRVVLTVRDDFFGQLGAEARALFAQAYFVKSPDARALREALVRPAALLGHRFEDEALVEEMVAVVAGDPAALPLLEFAASLLWERRHREGVLPRTEYRAMGGVAGALAQHANGVLARSAVRDLSTARTMLLRFVGPENTRRALRVEEATDGLQNAEPLLQRLLEARLLVPRKNEAEPEGEAKLELVHESLLRSWETLRGWIEDSRGARPVLEQAREAATLWEQRGKKREEVWTEEALREAERAVARAPADSVSQLVRTFLSEGKKLELRRKNERRGLAALAVLALAIFAGVLHREKEAALSAFAAARREAAETDLLNRKYLEARAKLRDSMEIEDSLQARMLVIDLERAPLWWRLDIDIVVRALDLSADESMIALAAVDNSIRVVRVETAEIRSLVGHEEQVFALAFAPDVKHLATGTQVGRVGVWDLSNGSYRELGRHEGAVLDLVWDPAGGRFFTAGADGTVHLYEGETGRVFFRGATQRLAIAPDGRHLAVTAGDRTIALIDAHSAEVVDRYLTESGVRALRFAADGAWLAVGHEDGTVGALDLKNRIEKIVEAKHRGEIRRLAIDRSGRHLASASEDQTVLVDGEKLDSFSEPVNGVAFFSGGSRLAVSTYHSLTIYKLDTLEKERATAAGHARPAVSVLFSPDGTRLVSASTDRLVKLWDVESGRELATLSGHEGPVHEMAFSPDGTLLATPSNDRTVRLWEVAEQRERARLFGHTGAVWTAAFSPDGRVLASTGRDRTIRLWDVAAGRELRVFEAVEVSGSLTFDRAGVWIASAEDDGAVRLYDAATGAVLSTFELHRAGVSFVAFSHDMKWLASSGEDGAVRRVSLADGAIEDVATTGGRAWAVEFSPDDRRLAIAASTGAWIKTFGGEQRALHGHRGEVNAIVFSPDGKRVATAGDDGTVRLWRSSDGTPLWSELRHEMAEVKTVVPEHFEDPPPSPVQEIRSLPGGLVAAGFASGHVGLWEAASGEKLRLEKLHGAIVHISFEDGRVAIRSELGASLSWDLSLLFGDRDAVLERLR